MTKFEWDGGLKITVYEEHKSLRHYRCLRCKSTRVTEYMLETDFGRKNKIKCHGCKKSYLYNPGGGVYDNLDELFEEIPADQVEHVEHKKKESKIVENDNQLAPLEFVDIWAANEFVKWNRCGICQAELITKPVEPYDDYIKAHFNVACSEHGLCIKGSAANLRKINSIKMDEMIREMADNVGNNSPAILSGKSEKQLYEELGF
jgi:NAD-dependent SIR2 family protein deacetylase